MRVELEVVRGKEAPTRLTMEAQDIAAATDHAGRLGYAVLRARTSILGSLPLPIGSTNVLDVTVLVEQLRDLLQAGLSVVEALDTLRVVSGRRDSQVIESLVERLRAGDPLSSAMTAQPVFPELLVALVRASEWTSDLPQALARYLEHESRVRELRHRVTSTAIYPVLLLLVGSAVLLFLLFYVVPRFARVFEGMHGDLPWSAEAMVQWSRFLNGNGLWLLLGFLIIGSVLAVTIGTPTFRSRVVELVIERLPWKEHLRAYFLARWYRATGMLAEGGIPLPQALALANGTLPQGLRHRGPLVERALREGKSPAQAYAEAGMVTPVAEQLMRAGERTGDLGAVLTRIAQFHESEVARSLERGMRVLEPVVMVAIGIGVGAVVVLMYMPIFELASAVR